MSLIYSAIVVIGLLLLTILGISDGHVMASGYFFRFLFELFIFLIPVFPIWYIYFKQKKK